MSKEPDPGGLQEEHKVVGVDQLSSPDKVEYLGRPEKIVPHEREKKRDVVAAVLAIGLLVVFAFILLSPVIYWVAWGKSPPTELTKYAKDGAAIVVGLLGAITAFYFSQKRLGG